MGGEGVRSGGPEIGRANRGADVHGVFRHKLAPGAQALDLGDSRDPPFSVPEVWLRRMGGIGVGMEWRMGAGYWGMAWVVWMWDWVRGRGRGKEGRACCAYWTRGCGLGLWATAPPWLTGRPALGRAERLAKSSRDGQPRLPASGAGVRIPPGA